MIIQLLLLCIVIFQTVIKDSPSTGMATVTFEKTPIMHSSNVFFMVTSLDRLPTVYSQDNISITLYGRTKILKNLQRSLKVALNAVNYYGTYLNYSLPLKKIGVSVLLFAFLCITKYFILYCM